MLFAPKGNLLTNGDFEDDAEDTPPEGWNSVNVTVGGPDTAFSGERAALLGGCDPCEPAVLYQDVNVAPLHKYQLTFQVSGILPAAGDLVAEVRWLDHCCTDMGLGLHVYMNAAAFGKIHEGIWDAQSHITDCAPIGAYMARILFTRSGKPDSGPNVLDGLSFANIT